MSESVIYDTHRHVKRITETGVSEDSAEAIIGSVTELIGTNIATKADIAQIKADISHVEAKLIKWFVGTMLVFFSAHLAVTIALITFR